MWGKERRWWPGRYGVNVDKCHYLRLLLRITLILVPESTAVELLVFFHFTRALTALVCALVLGQLLRYPSEELTFGTSARGDAALAPREWYAAPADQRRAPNRASPTSLGCSPQKNVAVKTLPKDL